jgi:fructose-1,6-bisphosphatase/inositol monophosphatase family enzyme
MNLIDRPNHFRGVAAILRSAATRLIVPRWQCLRSGDVDEKSPGEWVTIVDREVEEEVTTALLRLLPNSVVVGEERCAEMPGLLDCIEHGPVWLVDPLDGTGNFIAGCGPISLMVALLEDGIPIGAWMLDPLTGTLHHAYQGGGAWRDDQPVTIETQPSHLGRGIVKTRFLPADLRAHVAAAGAALEIQPGTNCAGADYPAIARAESDFAIYWRVLPWDHAPGALFAMEAGGCVARLDGRAYRPGEQMAGLLVARTPALWRQARALLPNAL